MKRFSAFAISTFLLLFLFACGDIYSTDNSRSNNGAAEISFENNEADTNNETSSSGESPYETNGEYEREGQGGPGDDGVPTIEVIENTILFDGAVVSLSELEQLIIEHNNLDLIWELHDTRRASHEVYREIMDLLIEYDIAFREVEN